MSDPYRPHNHLTPTPSHKRSQDQLRRISRLRHGKTQVCPTPPGYPWKGLSLVGKEGDTLPTRAPISSTPESTEEPVSGPRRSNFGGGREGGDHPWTGRSLFSPPKRETGRGVSRCSSNPEPSPPVSISCVEIRYRLRT